jgi:hypothetical protein
MGQQVCAPWAAPGDLCCEGGGTIDDCVDGPVALQYKWTDEQLIEAASNLLYARTGFRWPGACSFVVWPCIDDCHSPKHPCVRCCSYSAIQLPTDFLVLSVDAIIEDGVTLDPGDYRLERGNIVTRLDGLRWQRNSFGLPDCGVETTVEFTIDGAPPIEGRMAAAALACELKKSCNGEACALPANVTSFARRGVSVELTDLAEMLKTGATGIPIVDHFLGVWEQVQGATMFDPASGTRGQRAT